MKPENAAALGHLELAVKAATRMSVSEDEAADVIGTLHYIEKLLVEYRRNLLRETPASTGEAYQVVYRRKAKRSFNQTGIISAAADALNTDRASALVYLIDAGALRLSGQYTGLTKFAQKHDMSIAAAYHEIEDGDAEFLIGEVWEEYPVVQAAVPDQKTELGF